MSDQLLADVCEINGYKSVTDVSESHPATSSGRPVMWLEVVAPADAFRMVNNDDPTDVTKMNFDEDIRVLCPVRPSDLGDSTTAGELAFMLSIPVSSAVRRRAMDNWGGVG